MKILLVEDDIFKRENIRTQVVEYFAGQVEITEKESLRSAWRSIVSAEYDLILLDMSLPGADADSELGGEPESFAGREVMEQMRLRKLSTPVILVTQYQTFENGRVTLDQLIFGFEERYSGFFRGCIYYNSSSEIWRRELISKLSEVQEK